MNLNELYNENKNPFQDVVDKVAAKEKQADAEHTKGLKDIADKFQSAEKKSSEEFSKKLRPSVSEEEEKNQHSIFGSDSWKVESRLITATLPSFPGLISPDYGDATSLSGTTPAKTGQPQFHM